MEQEQLKVLLSDNKDFTGTHERFYFFPQTGKLIEGIMDAPSEWVYGNFSDKGFREQYYASNFSAGVHVTTSRRDYKGKPNNVLEISTCERSNLDWALNHFGVAFADLDDYIVKESV